MAWPWLEEHSWQVIGVHAWQPSQSERLEVVCLDLLGAQGCASRHVCKVAHVELTGYEQALRL